jgi:TolA-binding protein
MSKKLSLLLLIISITSATALFGQEQEKKPAPGIAEWLRGLQKRIAQIVPSKSIPVTTGVAGVRGAKEESQTKLYWKGKKGEEVVSEEEMTNFKAAIEIVSQGDKPAAVKELEKFMTKFPDSPLIPDAKKTLDLVKAEPLEKKAETKPDQKPEEKKDEKK